MNEAPPVRYHLELREASRPGVPDPRILVKLDGDAREIVHWLWAGVLTMTTEHPEAREDLRRFVRVWLREPGPPPPTQEGSTP